MRLKDYVTLGNLLCGFAAIIALFHDQFELACGLVYLAWVFDWLDGVVARALKQFDRFGEEFDTVCDYVTNSIVLSVIVFYAFERVAGYPTWLAAVLGGFPLVFGTIRQARSQSDPSSYPCYWIGLPRPILALLLVSMFGSSLFRVDNTMQNWGHGVAAGLIVVLSTLHLSQIPYLNLKTRRMSYMVRVGMFWFLAGTPIVTFISWWLTGGFEIFFDYLFFSMMSYTFMNWTQIPREDLRRIRHFLDTGECHRPLVHEEGNWKSERFAPFFDPAGNPDQNPPQNAS
jgi:CDP-diacylglycerol--serine O-phosphatidyltransferase